MKICGAICVSPCGVCVNRRGLSIICIATLALGLGASTALFSVVRAVLLKPLPFPDPGRLVMLYESNRKDPRFKFNVVAAGDFLEWQRSTHSFEQMALLGFSGLQDFSNGSGQLPEKVRTALCSWNLFSTLGVQPAYGCLFSPLDDKPNANATAVLAWSLFQHRFGGNPAVLGKTVLIEEKPYTVIGVLPRWFTYPDSRIQLWLPVFHEVPANIMQSHGMHTWNVVARLKPGISETAALSQIEGIQQHLYQQYPNEPVMQDAQILPLMEDLVGDFRKPLLVLLGAVGCLLLITCLNVANLLVARAVARRKELSIRAALGCTGWRLI